jgi:hypothetical protein
VRLTVLDMTASSSAKNEDMGSSGVGHSSGDGRFSSPTMTTLILSVLEFEVYTAVRL